MKKLIITLLLAISAIVVNAIPIRIFIHLDDGCFILIEGDYTHDLNGEHFSGTITAGGTSPHCGTGTWTITYRYSNPNDDDIEMVCECTDICEADRIAFTSRNQNNQAMVDYLNSIAPTILASFKNQACD